MSRSSRPSRRSKFTPLALCVTLACISTALAGLYGTSPVANTVWTAGRSETITWIDDKTNPRLSQMGPLTLGLYAGNDALIATLANGVDPMAKSQDVWVSPSWGHNGSDYYVTFTGKGTSPAYTSSFTIVGMADISPVGSEKSSPTSSGFDIDGLSSAYSSRAAANMSSPTSSHSGSTFATTVSGTQTSHSFASSSTSSVTSATTSLAKPASTLDPISPEEESDYLHRHHPYPNDAKGGRWWDNAIDQERLKFRLVFILWPALVGITMAL